MKRLPTAESRLSCYLMVETVFRLRGASNRQSFLFSAQIKTDSPFPVLSVPGDPGEIRTPDTLIRSQVLYPAELLGHVAGAEGLKPPTYGFGDRCSINCAMPLYPYVTVP